MMGDAVEIAFTGRRGTFGLDVAFRAPRMGVTALFGPSGCGKTSVLRAIAGLTRLDGRCRIGGETWQDGTLALPPHRRAVGYVFQEASLFAHLPVRRNLLYGAPRRAAQATSLDEIVDLLGLSALLDRAPHHLSGGERQRVAIGRALLSQPRLLLMDEPLAALDRATKDEILPFLERLVATLKIPMLYVSHDMSEVERLATHIVLMERGRVLASGPLADVQSDPALPLAGQRAARVTLDATIMSHDPQDGLLTLAVEGGRFLVPAPGGAAGARRRLTIMAGDVSLAAAPPSASTILNILDARILDIAAQDGSEITVRLGLGRDGAGAPLLARVSRRSFAQIGLAPGMPVYAQVKGAALAAPGDQTAESRHRSQ